MFVICSRYLRTLECQSEIDERELASLRELKQRYLDSAITNYLRCLLLDDVSDTRIFRLVALWFDNAVQSLVSDTLRKVQ